MATVTVLTWNLFHGRDHPVAASSEHAEVNRPLRGEFTRFLAGESWEVVLDTAAPLLDEVDQRSYKPGEEFDVAGHSVLLLRKAF